MHCGWTGRLLDWITLLGDGVITYRYFPVPFTRMASFHPSGDGVESGYRKHGNHYIFFSKRRAKSSALFHYLGGALPLCKDISTVLSDPLTPWACQRSAWGRYADSDPAFGERETLIFHA
jgi:hypothetical protein